jgi:hypothetical protein
VRSCFFFQKSFTAKELLGVWEFMDALDKSGAERQLSVAEGQATGAADADMRNEIEPTRFLTDRAPPRRFHRTFWRSVTRRLVELKQKNLA